MRTGELYQRYYGLYLATVVDVKDPENLGRVRIECDQFEDSKDDPIWCSVARPAAGVTSVFFTPKQDDQVVIGYLVGDANEPIVVGYAHGKKDRPRPEQVSPTQHGVVTKVGSVVFDEDAKKITVTFSTGGRASTITMNDDGIVIDAPRIEMTGDTVCINGQAVVLRNFIDKWYTQHVHPTAFGPTTQPIQILPPTPPESTTC